MKSGINRPCALGASLLTLLLLTALPAKAQLGAAVGLNYESFNDVDFGSRQAALESASGYHIGIFYDLAVGPVAIRPGVFYRSINNLEFKAADVLSGSRKVDINMVDVPIDLRFRMSTPVVKPYLLAGPVFSFASTSDKNEFADAIKDIGVAANIGVGVEVGLPGLSLRLFPEIRYGFGISRFMDENFEVGTTNFSAQDTQHINTLQVRLGVAL